jgi:hypothetical protein
LVGYGLKDFLYIFALVLVSACVAFLLWRLLQWLAARYRAWLVLQTTPSETDPPLVILKKLGRLRQSIRFGQAHAAGGNATERVFILMPWREPAFLWVAPPARLTPTNQATPEALNFVQQVAAGQIVDARQIAKRLKKGMGRWWTLAWWQVGTVDHPRKGPIANWNEDQAEDGLIEVA